MPLQSSGPISLLNIAGEFGGGTPHYISEYYRGGPYVPFNASTARIPTSLNQIEFADFYGASDGFRYVMSDYSSNVNNGTFYTAGFARGANYFASSTFPVIRLYTTVNYRSAEAGWIDYAGFWNSNISMYSRSRMPFGDTFRVFCTVQCRGWTSGFQAGGFSNFTNARSTNSTIRSSSRFTTTRFYPYLSMNFAVNHFGIRFRYCYGQAYAQNCYFIA